MLLLKEISTDLTRQSFTIYAHDGHEDCLTSSGVALTASGSFSYSAWLSEFSITSCQDDRSGSYQLLDQLEDSVLERISISSNSCKCNSRTAHHISFGSLSNMIVKAHYKSRKRKKRRNPPNRVKRGL